MTTGRMFCFGVALAVVVLWSTNTARAQEPPGPQLHVEYADHELSVDAHDVPLPDVLSAIAAKVGFAIVGVGASSDPVTLSVTARPPDQVLRRLLRAENHTIVYRRGVGSDVIDRIVLLGRPSPDVAQHPPDHGNAVAAGNGMPSVPPGSAVGGQAVAIVPGAVAPGAPTETGTAASTASPERDQPTVGEMLRTQALVGAPPAAPAGIQATDTASSAAAQATTAGPAPQTPMSTEDTLAVTTRRAQEGLAALVEGLQAATRAIQQQSAPSGQ